MLVLMLASLVKTRLRGLPFISAWGGGSAKLQGGLRCFGKIFRGGCHILKSLLRGELFETLHQLNPSSLY